MEYAVREQFGQHKRELLVDRVGDAKESQEAAKTEFVEALPKTQTGKIQRFLLRQAARNSKAQS